MGMSNVRREIMSCVSEANAIVLDWDVVRSGTPSDTPKMAVVVRLGFIEPQM